MEKLLNIKVENNNLDSYKLSDFENKKNSLSLDEQIENLSPSGLKIIQNKKLFMFGIDAILLNDFTKVKNNDILVDLCTGNGIIPLLQSKKKLVKIFGIEIQKMSAELAVRNVLINHLEEKIKIINDDIKNIFAHFQPQSINVVTCNPPYMKIDSAVKNSTDSISIARHEILCTIEDVIKAANFLLKPNGHFYLIHKPERIFEIFEIGQKFNLEIKRMRFVQPSVEKKATMVLMELVKCAKPGVCIESPLIIYKDIGIYSDEVQEVYKK